MRRAARRDALMGRAANVDAVFWSHVWTIPESGCWLHDGQPVGDGYASMSSHSRSVRAHRWAYERFVGPIERGMVVAHRCDVPCCVNPAHLFTCTQAENIADKVRKGRQAKGSKQGTSKLTEAKVSEIKKLLRRGYVVGMYSALARQYQVDRAIIARIHAGRIWRHA